jgi:hypothetical protein
MSGSLQEQLYKRGFAVGKPEGSTVEPTEAEREHAAEVALVVLDALAPSVMEATLDMLESEHAETYNTITAQITDTSGEKTNVQDNTSTTSSTINTQLEDIHMPAHMQHTHEQVESKNGNTDPVLAFIAGLTPEQRAVVAQMSAPQAVHAQHVAQEAVAPPVSEREVMRALAMRLEGRGVRANMVPVLQVAAGVALGAGAVAGAYYGLKYLFFSPVA